MGIRKLKINKKIEKFLKEFRKVAPLQRAILFGSYANGTAKKWSDIDLAVISKGFEGQDRFRRLVMLGKLAWKAGATEIEALGFTPMEYKKGTGLDFLSEIKNKGISVFPK